MDRFQVARFNIFKLGLVERYPDSPCAQLFFLAQTPWNDDEGEQIVAIQLAYVLNDETRKYIMENVVPTKLSITEFLKKYTPVTSPGDDLIRRVIQVFEIWKQMFVVIDKLLDEWVKSEDAGVHIIESNFYPLNIPSVLFEEDIREIDPIGGKSFQTSIQNLNPGMAVIIPYGSSSSPVFEMLPKLVVSLGKISTEFPPLYNFMTKYYPNGKWIEILVRFVLSIPGRFMIEPYHNEHYYLDIEPNDIHTGYCHYMIEKGVLFVFVSMKGQPLSQINNVRAALDFVKSRNPIVQILHSTLFRTWTNERAGIHTPETTFQIYRTMFLEQTLDSDVMERAAKNFFITEIFKPLDAQKLVQTFIPTWFYADDMSRYSILKNMDWRIVFPYKPPAPQTKVIL